MDSAPAQLPCTKQAMHRGSSFHVLFHVLNSFCQVLVVMDSYSQIYVGTHYFTLILYEHLCHMLIPYGIPFAPHLHDKEKREKKKERNETKQENFCGGKSSFVRA